MNLDFSGLSDAQIGFSKSIELMYSFTWDSIAFSSNIAESSIWILICVWHYKAKLVLQDLDYIIGGMIIIVGKYPDSGFRWTRTCIVMEIVSKS